MSFGKIIDSSVLEQGLRELCSDLNFDVATKRGDWHPRQSSRQGVFWNLNHICSMDRGMVPEFKQWSVVDTVVPVGWEEADKEDVSMQFESIPPGAPEYPDAALHVMKQDVGWVYRPDGTIVRAFPVARRKMQGRVIFVGWRHTFEALLRWNIPGVTRSSLAEKFGVDMLKFPVGPPHEVLATLTEE